LRLNAKDTPAWTRAIAQFMGSPDELKTWEDRVAKNYRPTTWDMAAKTFFATIAEKAR
jgi:hypothetical protein